MNAGTISIYSEEPKPTTKPTKSYIKIEDVWNTNSEIIVGTGDLRPNTVITANPIPLNGNGNGIQIASIVSGQLDIWIL